MFTGQAANLKLSRNGSKELVELTVSPWAGNPKGVHMRYLFDLQAHKAYSQDLDNNSCAWMKYASGRAPVNYDPISGAAGEPEMAKAKEKAVGTETVNGIPSYIAEIDSPQGKTKVWLAQKGDFPVKMVTTGQDGKPVTLLEVKRVDFSPPAASLFTPPANCGTQTQGEWSDHGVSAHAEANIDVQGSASTNLATGETHSQATATLRQGSSSGRSQGAARDNGGNGGDFLDATDILHMPHSTNTCTVLFRAVRAGTMEPITSGLEISLDGHDMTGQYRNGILRLNNPPSRFSMQVDEKNGAGRGTDLSRACFRPETVLLLVISPDFIKEPDHWYWVRSGKYATISAVPAKNPATPTASPATPAGKSSARVTEVQLKVDPVNYSGPCPVKVKLTGTLTADGPGTAYYEFQAGAVGAGREGTVNVNAAGTATVSSEGSVRSTPQVQTVRFLAGMEPRGNQENAEFTDVDLNLACTPRH